jgi:alpha-tubulin suppressor-like RCC1 family protein
MEGWKMGLRQARSLGCWLATLGAISLLAAASASGTSVKAWGANQAGQLGDNSRTNSNVPVSTLIPPLDEVTAVSAGLDHSLALLSDGTVIAWGANKYGQLGDGTTATSHVPVAVSGLSGVTAIAAGNKFDLALLSSGTVVSWGRNPEGELGDGTSAGPETCGSLSCSRTPVPVGGLTEVKAISASYDHSLALLKNGKVMMWGSNAKGELGIGTPTGPESCVNGKPCSTVPVAVCPAFVPGHEEQCPGGPYLSNVTAVSVGYSHTVALLSDSTAVAWGGDSYGELGAAGAELGQGKAKARSYLPVVVKGLKGAVNVAAGHKFSLALMSNATVMAWGRNTNGELGIGTTGERSVTPVQVCAVGATGPCPSGPYLSGVSAVAAGGGSPTGYAHGLALLAGGAVAAWGDNGFGELGNGTTTASDVPVKVCAVGTAGPCPSGPFLSGITGISAGRYHSLALGG